MTSRRSLFGTASVALVVATLALAGPAPAAAPSGTDLWGGPAAKGTGANGSKFDTTITIASIATANGSVDYLAGGVVVTTVPFSISGRGVASLPTPAALDGMGAFLYHVRSDASVTAWSETYNDTPNGRYSVSTTAFPVSDFLTAGDESWGGGADASSSTDPGRARTNVGVLCSPLGNGGCNVEWAAFDNTGTLLGSTALFAAAGAAAQQSLATLVPAAAEKSGLSIRARVTSGSAAPYAIKNDNLTSDGTGIPLSIVRSAFSTAPTISSFTITPTSGCSPLTALATWVTTGADHVNVTGASGDLPPSGSTNITVVATGDVVLTAVAASGATATQPKRVDVSPATDPPTPTPATAVTGVGLVVTGVLPVGIGAVTVSFDRQDSTGSTFTVNANQFTYKAGTVTGTDIVRLTTQGLCGPASATFTATVTKPGTPVITSFTAQPPRGCGPSSNIVLFWTTENAKNVTLDLAPGFFYSPNGGVGVTITGTTTANLTAHDLFGGGLTATAALTIPVDPQAYVPILTPNNIIVPQSSATVILTVTGVPDPTLLKFVIIQNQSGSVFQFTPTPGQFAYVPGFRPGTDIIRIFFTNGCGSQYAEFTAHVQ